MSLTRVAILSSAGGGGAGIAARRFADALVSTGAYQADFIDIAALGDHVPQTVSPQDNLNNHTISDTHFTLERVGDMRGWFVDMLADYDVVMVHWASYLISLAELLALAARGTRMLMHLHDFHYITGGCHYPAGCAGYKTDCAACPQLDRNRANPVEVQQARRLKAALFAHPNVHLSAPSHFLRDAAVAAGLVPGARAHVLRNAYVPLRAAEPERPATNRLLLIADSLEEGRKNMPFALEVLGQLAQTELRFCVDVVGAAAPGLQAMLQAGGVPHVFHGRITDHARLSEVAAGTDVLLTASLEDNWPNVLVEAGAYGVQPVVGPGHGCAEFVTTYGFGQIARDYSHASFLTALAEVFNSYRADKRRRAVKMIRSDHRPANVIRHLETIAAMIPHRLKDATG